MHPPCAAGRGSELAAQGGQLQPRSTAYRPALERAPARVPPTGPGTTSTATGPGTTSTATGPGTTSTATGPGTTSTATGPGTTSMDECVHERCLPPATCAPLPLPRVPSAERRRRWSHRTRARAQAACHRPSSRLAVSARLREVASRLRGARGGGPAVAARRGAPSPPESSTESAASHIASSFIAETGSTPDSTLPLIKARLPSMSDGRASLRGAHGSGVTGR
jgi:hypothetical protein